MSKTASAVVADPDTPIPDCNAWSAAAPEVEALVAAEGARSQEVRRSAALQIEWHVDCHKSAEHSTVYHGGCRRCCAVVKKAGQKMSG